jgi:hypothetical protein
MTKHYHLLETYTCLTATLRITGGNETMAKDFWQLMTATKSAGVYIQQIQQMKQGRREIGPEPLSCR